MHIEPIPRQKPAQSKHDVYYEGNKKNELNDLRIYFKKVVSNTDMTSFRKEVIKKITILTTQGVDTSRFYPQMVIASATNDLVQKKLVFNYLSIYSQLNADFARMAINTFTKDSNSANPNIRALAIRNLSNLRFKGREEYVMPILKKGLDDFSPTVRKACLMGMTKLINEANRKTAEPVRDEQLLNSLYGMIRDNDPHVVCCALQAINQIQPEGIAISKKLAQYLLNSISNGGYDHIQLSTILNYIELYDPKSQQEVMKILSQLQAFIHSQNLSLVLSITKIFIKYSQIQPQIKNKIHQIIRPCLLSFIGHPFPEIQHCALKHIIYIVNFYKYQGYVDCIKKFYIRADQQTYIKAVKIQLMQLCCTKNNFVDILNQFTEYLKQDQIVENVMEALTNMILRFEQNQAKTVIKTLNDVVINYSSNDNICNAAILTIRTFLRKYPNLFSMFQHTFYTYVKGVTTSQSRCAMIEIIGDFGEHIQDAVELLVWSEGNLQDELKIALLRANVKLFFKRPIEMLNMTTNLFRYILTDEQTRLPVRDYATMLYLGLQNDIEGFKKSFLANRSFSEGIKIDFPQFQINTLEIAYCRNKSEWLIDKSKYIELLNPIEYGSPQNQQEVQNNDQLYAIQELQQKRSMVDLTSNFKQIDPANVDAEFDMDADNFETYWENFQIGSSITRIIKNIQFIDEETLEELFKMWHIKVMASGQEEDNIKQFLYMRLLQSGQIACLQLGVNKQVETLTLLIKSENQEFAGFVSRYVEDFLKLNDVI